jgi:peptide/nickel transport system permease protein
MRRRAAIRDYALSLRVEVGIAAVATGLFGGVVLVVSLFPGALGANIDQAFPFLAGLFMIPATKALVDYHRELFFSANRLAYFAAISFAVPGWWLGILFILLFAFKLNWLPSGGMFSTPPPQETWPRLLDLGKHALLPIITLVTVSAGPYIYTVRTMTMTVAQEDHVALARAKGLPEGRVLRRHILRVAAPPIVTGLVLGLAGSLSGSILVETIFNWQGMGQLYFQAIGALDEAVVVALTFIFTLLYVVLRFVLDVLYLALDPRVRYA